jgi:transcription elongation factor GreA
MYRVGRSTIIAITSLAPKETCKRRDIMDADKTVYLSKKGIKELRKEIARLERERQEAFAALREIDKTDAHEERLNRMEKLAQIEVFESELADKRQLLARTKQLPRRRDVLRVAIGSVVDLMDTSGRIIRYTLVDSHEANPSDGRISIVSPLGKNLIGKQIKDIVEWSGSIRTNRLQLIAIT